MDEQRPGTARGVRGLRVPPGFENLASRQETEAGKGSGKLIVRVLSLGSVGWEGHQARGSAVFMGTPSAGCSRVEGR